MSSAQSPNVLKDPELEKVAAQFRLLGEPMRLKILQAICDKPRAVSEIVEVTGATQPNVSRHLALLAAAGVIQREKDGQFAYYSLRDPLTMKVCRLVHTQLFDQD
jgi:DNA-binding transcriptional ArsR family regulator